MPDQHPLQQWFASSGVQLHPSLYLAQDPLTGLSFYTAAPLPPDTTVIEVPKTLCITSASALSRIQLLLETLGSTGRLGGEELPAPDWILLYLVLSRLAEQYFSTSTERKEELEGVFTHLAYISHIPTTIETPLHFSPAELTLLSNTPLLHSTERRLRETIIDYERASSLLSSHLSSTSHAFSSFLSSSLSPIAPSALSTDPLMTQTFHPGLELWRWAESAFTSRSFPGRLIGLSFPTPILIPAYDTFNHARARPVTWTYKEDGAGVCMTLNYAISEGGQQVWNNYGGKSNEEFLSSYGFVLDSVSEDTLALKLGGEDGEGKTHYWLVPPSSMAEPSDSTGFTRAKCPCPPLLDELERRVLGDDGPPTSEEEKLELYGSVLETLEAMLLAKRKAFRASQKDIEALYSSLGSALGPPQEQRGWHRSKPASDTTSTTSYRPSVYRNVMQYRAGQLHLLNHAVDWTRTELGCVADALDDFETP